MNNASFVLAKKALIEMFELLENSVRYTCNNTSKMNLLTKQEGLNYRIEGKTLILEHSGHAKIRSWSIFDISGAEKCNGKFAEADPNTIDISCLAPGVYEVCLMDDEKLRRARFKIASNL